MQIPEVDEDNEVLEAHFLGNLGAKIIADDFATTRAHFASKAAFIAKEADFIGEKSHDYINILTYILHSTNRAFNGH